MASNGGQGDISFNDRGRHIRKMRKFALVLSFTSSQVLILFPLLLCAKIYLYPELHWSWLLVIPQLSATLWLLLIPFSKLKLLGFFLLSSPTFVALGFKSNSTYWGCHTALFPFFLLLLGNKRVPLGLIVSLQLHLECILSLFKNPELIRFPLFPTPLGVLILIHLILGTVLLPLAILSVSYLVHRTTKSVVAMSGGWILLCTLLSFNAVHPEPSIPLYIYGILFSWIGACVTLDGLMVYVSWRSRLSGLVWPFVSETSLAQPVNRESRQRGLTNREINELPISVIKSKSHQLPYDALCTICQDNVEEGQPTLLLPACHHVFHPECVIQWLKRKPVCPNCNLNVREGITSTRTSLSSLSSRNNQVVTIDPASSYQRSTVTRFSRLMGALITGRSHQQINESLATVGRQPQRNAALGGHSRRTALFPSTIRRIHPTLTPSAGDNSMRERSTWCDSTQLSESGSSNVLNPSSMASSHVHVSNPSRSVMNVYGSEFHFSSGIGSLSTSVPPELSPTRTLDARIVGRTSINSESSRPESLNSTGLQDHMDRSFSVSMTPRHLLPSIARDPQSTHHVTGRNELNRNFVSSGASCLPAPLESPKFQ